MILWAPLVVAQGAVQLDSLLLDGVTARSNREYKRSLEILIKVQTIAQDKQLYKQQFLALNNIGANYYSMLDYGEALDNYLEAYTIALKHLEGNEEMIVLNNIAILYSKEGDYDKAEEYFRKAYDLALNSDNYRRAGLYGVNLGIVANQQNNLDEATKYLHKAKEMLSDDVEVAILADIALVDNYYKRGELEKARALAQNILPQLSTTALMEEKFSLQILISKIMEDLEDYSSAIDYAKRVISTAPNPENRMAAYEQLSEVYQKNNQFDKALQAKDSVILLTGTVNNLKNGKLYETNRVKFEVADYQRELLQNKELRIKERNTLYTLLALALGIILLIAWALRNSYIKNKQRRILHQRSREFIELELQKKESDNLLLEKQLHAKEAMAMLEEERLKNEIENRNRKLAAKALQISSRNELIKEVINSLTDQSEIVKNTFLSNKVRELKKLLKSDSEWESFLTHFEEVNQGLLLRLRIRHPELTANDVRFLSYLYMDLTTKEISSLLNITVEATRKRKERISTKLGLGDSSSVYSYITRI